jgi:serine phosphatase RsbU (regulator of sigma subunit)
VLVGAFPGLAYGAMDYLLAPGETLFCYTDGVTEAANPAGEEFSEQRCLDWLARQDNPPLPAALDALRREVSEFTGQPLLSTRSKITVFFVFHNEYLDDDCTMLAIRRPGS